MVSARGKAAPAKSPETASKTNVPAALNLGFTDWDSREMVARNRAAFLRAVLGQKFGQQPTPQSAPHAETAESLLTLRQIHSDVVRVFSTPAATAPQADAAISGRAGLFLGFRRPIASRFCSWIHAGASWRRFTPDGAERWRASPSRRSAGCAGVRHQSRRCDRRAWPGDWPLLL